MDHGTIDHCNPDIAYRDRSRLSEAVRIAKAAEACALAGSRRRNRFDGPRTLIFEAGRLQDAASLPTDCRARNGWFLPSPATPSDWRAVITPRLLVAS